MDVNNPLKMVLIGIDPYPHFLFCIIWLKPRTSLASVIKSSLSYPIYRFFAAAIWEGDSTGKTSESGRFKPQRHHLPARHLWSIPPQRRSP